MNMALGANPGEHYEWVIESRAPWRRGERRNFTLALASGVMSLSHQNKSGHDKVEVQ
jgi:hypothetical protein